MVKVMLDDVACCNLVYQCPVWSFRSIWGLGGSPAVVSRDPRLIWNVLSNFHEIFRNVSYFLVDWFIDWLVALFLDLID